MEYIQEKESDATGKLIISVKTLGVEGIDAETDNSEPIYYNLQGIRIERPAGGVYVRVKGNKAEKVAL